MRIIPVITALLVMAALYLVVFERPALIAFATGVEATEAAATETAAATPAPAAAISATANEAPPVSVVALRSAASVIDAGAVLRGRTEAARQVEVRAETSGLVISEPLWKGTAVSAGTVLCRLDPGTRQATLAEARARLAEAQVNESAAASLAAKGFGSETQAIARKAALEGAQAGVELATREIERLTIKAPFDGILDTDSAELGTLLQPGGLCAKLIKLDPIKMVGFAPETEIDRFSLGAQAGARLANGRQVLGEVTYLSRSADPTTRTFRVEVEVANPDLSIRDGATAEIFVAFRGEPAHLLPQSALTLDDTGELGVRIVVDEIAQFAPVTVLRDTASGIWLGGLPQTADVIVVGQEYVVDGRRVAATYREN